MIPVVLDAVAVYVAVPAPLHLLEFAPSANTGAETVGVVVTVWVETALEQPVATAVITLVPDHPAANVTTPVAELMVFPAARLVASRL